MLCRFSGKGHLRPERALGRYYLADRVVRVTLNRDNGLPRGKLPGLSRVVFPDRMLLQETRGAERASEQQPRTPRRCTARNGIGRDDGVER